MLQDCGEKEKARQERLAFRPESAPTVLDMSPDGNSRHSSSDGFLKHGKSHTTYTPGKAGFRSRPILGRIRVPICFPEPAPEDTSSVSDPDPGA